jgi:hypothetical protein
MVELCLGRLRCFIMPSCYDGWTAHDIIGPLNKREVRAALLDFEIQKSNFRNWDSVERMVLGSSDDVKNVLFRCGEAKRKVEDEHRICMLKRRRESRMMSRNVRRRLRSFYFNLFLKRM